MLEPPLEPMLLSRKTEPFNGSDYIFEIKWDGYRCLIFMNGENIMLQSRNKKNLSKYFPELSGIYRSIKADNAVLDGEICYLDNEGKPVFSKLQGRLSSKNPGNRNPVTLIIWDILALNKEDIYQKPLLERKRTLDNVLEDSKQIIKSPYIFEKGIELYKKAEAEDLEGIVAKKIDSPYEFKRSRYWYKIKCWKYLDTYIGGYSSDGSSFAVGRFYNEQLRYMGKIKIALSGDMQEALFHILPTITNEKCPFKNKPKLKGIIWVNPVFKTRVRYSEITTNHTFRHGFAVKILLPNENNGDN